MSADQEEQYGTDANLAARQRLWATARREPSFDFFGWVLDLAGVEADGSPDVLDLGCGNGLYECRMDELGHVGNRVALDLSAVMLAQVQGANRVLADAQRLSVPESPEECEVPTRGSAEDRKVVDLRGGVPARQAALDKWVWAGGDALVVDGAAAAVRVAEMHPVRAWVVLAVSPETPSADVVALVAAARHEAGRPLKLRTWDLGQVDTLIAAGARPLIESHLVTLDRDDLPSTWDLPEELLIHDRKPDEPEFLSAA